MGDSNGDSNEKTKCKQNFWERVLQKILEKVSVTKKFTQYKTSCTLKIDVFGIPDGKFIEQLFSKY